MKLRKNTAAKIAAALVSVAGLVGFWGVVHRHPPPSAVDAAVSGDATPATSPTVTSRNPPNTSPKATPGAPTRHTRTRAS